MVKNCLLLRFMFNIFQILYLFTCFYGYKFWNLHKVRHPKKTANEGALLQELLKMKLSSGILQNIGMKKPHVGAGTFCPLYILLFSIPPCRKYLPVSGARDSPYCYRKIPEDPQIKNVRKNCRRFTAWGGKVQDLAIFIKVRNNRGSLVYSL